MLCHRHSSYIEALGAGFEQGTVCAAGRHTTRENHKSQQVRCRTVGDNRTRNADIQREVQKSGTKLLRHGLPAKTWPCSTRQQTRKQSSWCFLEMGQCRSMSFVIVGSLAITKTAGSTKPRLSLSTQVRNAMHFLFCKVLRLEILRRHERCKLRVCLGCDR
jgi:hypothetical protein